MKRNILIALFAMLLAIPYAGADFILDEYQPCGNEEKSDPFDNNGHRMIITNKTPNMVSGKIYLALADYDSAPIEFIIPAGKQFLMHSCLLENRLGFVSHTAMEAAGIGVEEVLSHLKIPMTKELAEIIMKTQGKYAVCFKRIEFKYTTAIGENRFSSRAAKQITKNYYHSFGALAAGIACNPINIVLKESNGELQITDEHHNIWKWTDISEA